jgi:DNA-binding MarR family transcriptional regulator
MGLSHSRAVRVVDRLEETGLARRAPDPTDGRRALVWLEPAGRKLADRALRARSRVLDAPLSALSAAELRALDEVLAVLLGAMTADERAAVRTCRLCDVHSCGHYEGACPVTQAADRWRARA